MIGTNKPSVPFVSPSKNINPFKNGSPQIPSLTTSRDQLTRRVWIRRLDGNPTSLQVKESHLVDDLKMMIAEKFPTTLAKICDPSDVIIRLESGSTSYGNSPTTPSSNKKFLPPPPIPSFQGQSNHYPMVNSPLSPIPISTRQSTLIQPKVPPQISDLGFHSSNRASLSPSIPLLEPDRSVWSILDAYYPTGQGMENAFIIEIPNHILAQSSYIQTNNTPPNPIRKSFSSDTIIEGKEEDYYTNQQRRLSSVPTHHHRSGTPGGGASHRRTQSNPAEHASAVLLLPSASSDPWKKGFKRSSTDTLTKVEPTTNFNSDEQSNTSVKTHTKNKLSDSASIGSGKSTMAKVLPSINVLIVEDNLINLRILVTHLKRHRIHYDVAKNGKEAIDKWREGGFHLVLMDIQLPVMSGLEASREIRRLEKINHIGVFANSDLQNMSAKTEADQLDLNVFRSPIIIVALTASNLKQDKQEALAAGCNDYLTKPVNLDWLLNKITEWGCMQALIDFDGWKSGERMTNISAAIPALARNSSSNARTRSHSSEKQQY